jgi:endonuclease/exonuclease/phosphatase family metal-dependent hydrolase
MGAGREAPACILRPFAGMRRRDTDNTNPTPPNTAGFRLPWIGRWIEWRHAFGRLFSSAHWSARLLGLSHHDEADSPGLLLIQIDGLSRAEFERALAAGRMPHTRRLIDHDGFRLHDFYSGLPSTTPAVQGELFYGRKACVPAFVYFDRRRRELVKMLSSETAERIEQSLQNADPQHDDASYEVTAPSAEGRLADGLLAGGSAYSNIYTGGAAEPHFCAASSGLNDVFTRGNPISLLLALGWNFSGVARIVFRLLLQTGASIFDLVRAAFGKLDFKREREFIPSRLGVGVVLEELMTMSAAIDLARGLPVVQLNYLAYDERGHLRGPGGPFAHRQLRRIDRQIGRLVAAAHRSNARGYEVWVYADHGQEATVPYDDVAGRTLVDAVKQTFALKADPQALDPASARLRKLGYLRRRRRAATPPTTEIDDGAGDEAKDSTIVAAIGPVGHIYLPATISEDAIERACRDLVERRHVPVALRRGGDGRIAFWTSDGKFQWPGDSERIVGVEHPFGRPIRDDLIRLCEHPDVGDVVILGWRDGLPPISFVRELGAHAGLAPRETRAFALLPSDVRIVRETAGGGAEGTRGDYLRPDDLRRTALRYLGRNAEAEAAPGEGSGAERLCSETLRVVTYNVHCCVGLDGRLSVPRIANVLGRIDADVVALQELDVNRSRSGRCDQARELARLLGMKQVLFHPAISNTDEHYGDAILSRRPIRLMHAGGLPGRTYGSHLEPRGAIRARIEFAGLAVDLVNTHLGLSPEERAAQVEALLGSDWTRRSDQEGATILLGDFNARPDSPVYRRLTAEFQDCQTAIPGRRPERTWFGPWPLARIDHVFYRGPLAVRSVRVIRNLRTTVASDHLPLVVDFGLAGCESNGAGGVSTNGRR